MAQANLVRKGIYAADSGTTMFSANYLKKLSLESVA
jgi:hypothetical protein